MGKKKKRGGLFLEHRHAETEISETDSSSNTWCSGLTLANSQAACSPSYSLSRGTGKNRMKLI